MRLLIDNIKRFTRHDFIKDVLKLATGTVLARVITLGAMPIVTRLYSPEDFALLAVYMAVLGMISIVACLRFDIAIPLAENDKDAVNLLALSLLAVLLVVSITSFIILFAPASVSKLLGSSEIMPYIWLAPLGFAMAGTYSAMQHWFTRMRRFSAIALTRIAQATTGVVTMLALGWVGIAPLGLLLGNALNIGSGGIGLGHRALQADSIIFRGISIDKMVVTFRKYIRYPLFSTPEALANTAGIQVPILLIAAQGGSEAGFLFLAKLIIAVPMSLLGGSIAQVYMSRASEEFRNGSLAKFTSSIMRQLAVVGAVPLILIGIISPMAFPFLFGEEWGRAGEIVSWLVPWMVLQFIASPVSMVMFVVGRQREMLALTIFGAIIRIGFVAYAINIGVSPVMMFAVSSAVFYSLCCVVFLTASRDTNYERGLV